MVESCGVCNIIGSGLPEEASRGSLSRWLKGESDTDIAEKTKHSVLEAQEASRNIPLAKELKLFEESSEEPVTGLASPPGMYVCVCIECMDTVYDVNTLHCSEYLPMVVLHFHLRLYCALSRSLHITTFRCTMESIYVRGKYVNVCKNIVYVRV